MVFLDSPLCLCWDFTFPFLHGAGSGHNLEDQRAKWPLNGCLWSTELRFFLNSVGLRWRCNMTVSRGSSFFSLLFPFFLCVCFVAYGRLMKYFAIWVNRFSFLSLGFLFHLHRNFSSPSLFSIMFCQSLRRFLPGLFFYTNDAEWFLIPWVWQLKWYQLCFLTAVSIFFLVAVCVCCGAAAR